MRIVFTGLVCFVLGCAGQQISTSSGGDPSMTARSTHFPTCRWVPTLPEEREDPCGFDNAGAELSYVTREDWRLQSREEYLFTCVCQ